MTEAEFMEFMDKAEDYCRKHPRTFIVMRTFEFNGETIPSGFHRFAEGSCGCGHCNPELAKMLIEIEKLKIDA